MMNERILLVGDKRICPQVAYVMDWQNCAMVERLSAGDVSKYADYKIVICDFKRKRKRYIPVGGGGGYTYLDDVCRELDQDYSFAEHIKSLQPQKQRNKILKKIVVNPLALKLLGGIRNRWSLRNLHFLRHLHPMLLKPSELFIRVIYARPSPLICDSDDFVLNIDAWGKISCCATGLMPLFYGNLLVIDKTVLSVPRTRIIKLSFLNGSYCFCNLNKCSLVRHSNVKRDFDCLLSEYPNELNLAIDPSCNLSCPSCRQEHYINDEQKERKMQAIFNHLLNSGLLAGINCLCLASMGEVFLASFTGSYLPLIMALKIFI